MHTIIAITAVAIAREQLWHLLVVPIYRPIYEAMRRLLALRQRLPGHQGAEFSWDKLERRNTVVRPKARNKKGSG